MPNLELKVISLPLNCFEGALGLEAPHLLTLFVLFHLRDLLFQHFYLIW
jgi:hypothetical protein